jgi:hypothetical protein
MGKCEPTDRNRKSDGECDLHPSLYERVDSPCEFRKLRISNLAEEEVRRRWQQGHRAFKVYKVRRAPKEVSGERVRRESKVQWVLLVRRDSRVSQVLQVPVVRRVSKASRVFRGLKGSEGRPGHKVRPVPKVQAEVPVLLETPERLGLNQP